MQSLMEIARVMDPIETPRGLRQLAGIHRWISGSPPEPLSTRELSDRHNLPQARKLRALWYNTFLFPGVEVPWVSFFTGRVEEAPDLQSRAQELGQAIRIHDYDLAILAEVFEHQSAEHIIKSIGTGVDAMSASGPPAGDSSPALSSGGLQTISIGNPIVGSETLVFTQRGHAVRDADWYANKGVLRTVVDIPGAGAIDVYSTHMYAGGISREIDALDLDPPSPEERAAIRRAQLNELIAFVNETSEAQNVAIIAGDFNIDAQPPHYDHLVAAMDTVKARGCEDIWARRNGSLGLTSNLKKQSEGDAVICETALDNPRFCSDEEAVTAADGDRIDYIFLERPTEEHRLNVEITRPRRVHFRRTPPLPSPESPPFLSDHIGIEVTMIVSPR